MKRTATVLLVTIAAMSAAPAQSPVEHGRYLVEGILACGNCHSPRGPGGVVDTKRVHSGGPQVFDEPTFKVVGANITMDRETGIGAWSDAEIKRAIRQGVRPNGTPLAPIMPSAFYKILAPADLDAAVAYMRSLPPVANKVAAPIYKAPMHSETIPNAGSPMSEADMRDPVKRGFYLVTIGHCMECHTPRINDRQDFVNDLGKGGRKFPGPWGESVARNITSHKDKGIGAWTDAEIKRAITQGVRKDGSRLKPPMAYPWYAKVNDADLSAMVAYLRTVPAKE
jgi:mono/diheme cytochrome c family protein